MSVKNQIVSIKDDQAFDQACKYGCNVFGHSVYCKNEDAPSRKCRRTLYTGGEVRDEDCEWYEANEIK